MSNIKQHKASQLYRWVIVSLFFIISLFFWLAELNKPNNASIDSPYLGGDFVLQSASGPVALSDYRGKVVILYFGYTFCPDICPTSLGLLSLAFNELTAEEMNNVQAFFISVDPERDTVERLKTYAEAFHPNIIGMTGDPITIADITQRYGVMYMKAEMPDSAMGYAVDHSSQYYVVGRDGLLQQQILHGTKPQQIASVIRDVLNK
ncbi:MAG: SCO family protein [Gammaproteobacteria bacterium]|nr:SCO family protein [Gammaproteobacteria bacterium]